MLYIYIYIFCYIIYILLYYIYITSLSNYKTYRFMTIKNRKSYIFKMGYTMVAKRVYQTANTVFPAI